ncbi:MULTISPECIES: hypothetical protein [unclassified Tenacibaculum]|uniref:hypothetical protein n=1 Tax=unclassified Tenacibaculum TaxID=2635139 RepID=UPI001F43B803|nr:MULTISPECIES: hypothetical protein [unclassified Tenacibaculum]MCF2875438.1 hypothetical protein [Tenacibaculum sp. Cn5-1]MCF2935514.1 hypothetical protein [Tenacibaculum sp. Cn5-34]MCG7512074.1 hypothetical protein [Tenacibaculum sp. Cn5-46]
MSGKKIEVIRENITLIYFGLVCVGYASKFHFYDYFNIDIENYLTLQEIIFSFLPITSFVLTLVLIIVLLGSINVYDESLNENKESTKGLLFKFNRKNKFFKISILLSAFFLGLPIYSTHTGYYLPNWIVIIIMLLSLLVHVAIIIHNYNNEQINSKNISYYILIIISLFLLYSFNVNRIKAKEILKGKVNKTIVIESKNDTIKSSKDIVYIGETNNYFFFRNRKSSFNLIIKKSDYNIVKIKNTLFQQKSNSLQQNQQQKTPYCNKTATKLQQNCNKTPTK